MVTKYYRHPYIYRSNSADKETYRVKFGTTMNKHEILANTEKKLSKMTVRKEIEQNEWSGTKAENRIEIKTGKTTGCSNTQQLHSWI